MLNMPDYQASERSYQLMVQVAGRAGRHEKKGKVLIQTYQPENDLFRYLMTRNHEGFVLEEKRMRDVLGYPPYGKLTVITVQSEFEKRALAQASRIHGFYKQVFERYEVSAQIFEPNKPHYAKIKNKYRYHLVIKCQLEDYDQMVKMMYNGLIKNKYDLIDDMCHVSIDFDPTQMI